MAGRALVEPAQHILDAVDEARRLARYATYTGRLSIGIMPGGAAEFTQPIITGLAQRFPGVEQQYRHLRFGEWQDGILDEVDLLICSPPLPDRDTVQTEILSEPTVVAYPTQFLDGVTDVLPLHEVVTMPMLNMAIETDKKIRDYWSITLTNGQAPRTAGPEVREPQEVCEVVAAGHCAALGPAWARRAYPTQVGRWSTVLDVPATPLLMVSLADCKEFVPAMHQEVAAIVKSFTPWLLPDSSGQIVPTGDSRGDTPGLNHRSRLGTRH